MSRITWDLLRKRSEHNEGEIHNLEEISLHQQNIVKIELLNQACKHLKILLLQNNIISKIENLNKLKKLQYLNLAINNIELIENLQGLESLQKLDLSVNFIADLKSVKNLRHNRNLQQLMLMGNPCAEYDGYRCYVIAVLAQIKEFDTIQISRTERIESLQSLAKSTDHVVRSLTNYSRVRQRQIEEHNINQTKLENDDSNFWNQKSANTPETRIAIAQKRINSSKVPEHAPEDSILKREPILFSPEGRPYNVNRAKVAFKFVQDENNIILQVAVYKHLDTCHIDVDIQTFYVRVTIKGKVLQLTLPCEVCPEKSFAERNIVTGSLAITMPRLHPSDIIHANKSKRFETSKNDTKHKDPGNNTPMHAGRITKRELLEIGPPSKFMDFLKIVKQPLKHVKTEQDEKWTFDDNPDVPPLE